MATLHLPRLGGDGNHPTLDRLRSGFWATCGAVVLLFIFLAALGGIDPAEAEIATAVVVVLALLWLAHSWRRLWSEDAPAPRAERERRGS